MDKPVAKPAAQKRKVTAAPTPPGAQRKPARADQAGRTRTVANTAARRPVAAKPPDVAAPPPVPPVQSAPPAPVIAPVKTLRRVPPVPRRTDTVPVIDLEPEDADPPSDGPPSSLDPDHASSSVRRAEASEAVGDEAPGRLDPSIVAGDPDADVESAHSIGDEVPGGENQTPDQDDVDLIGRSVGVEYDPEEELEGGVEILKRDQHRWELDPASSDDFRSRVKR